MDNNQILLSCIVPFYNASLFIHDLAASLFSNRADWTEYIFVNDASTDGCETELACLAAAYNVKNFKIITLDANGGPSRARNVGLELARGEYIWFLDSDDIVNPSSWPLVRNLLEPGNIDVLVVNFAFTTVVTQQKLTHGQSFFQLKELSPAFAENKTIQTRSPANRTLRGGSILNRNDGVVAALFRDGYLYTWSIICKKELWEGVRFPDGKLIEDVCTLPRLFFRATNFYFLDMPVIFYVQRSSSILGTGGKTVYTSLCESMQILKSYIANDSIQLTSEERLALDFFHMQTLVWAANNYFQARLTRDKSAMAVLAASLQDLRKSARLSGLHKALNSKSLMRRPDFYVARIILLSPRLYFIMRRFFEGLGLGHGLEFVRFIKSRINTSAPRKGAPGP